MNQLHHTNASFSAARQRAAEEGRKVVAAYLLDPTIL